jgi:hypothetical protein
MLTLPPYPPRQAYLKSFWLIMSLAGGVLAGTLSPSLAAPGRLVIGAAVAVLLALPGAWRPDSAAIPYRVWNKLAYAFTHLARLWLMGVCFYIVCILVGRTGSALVLARPPADGSLWVRRQRSAPAMGAFAHGLMMEESGKRGWVSQFIAWAGQSGHGWACSLLPFLALLSAMEGEQEGSDFAANIYTLF